MTDHPKGTPPPNGARATTPYKRAHTPLGVVVPKLVGRLEAVVLVVDGDAVSRRFVEIALTSEPKPEAAGFVIETAKDAASAMGILQTTLVDLIILESDLPDMPGLALQRRLQRESRLATIPVLFLSADAKVKTKIRALSAGVDDYLVKPCDPFELRARAEAILVRYRSTRDAAVRRGYVLAGDFSVIPFPDLVGILGMGHSSGDLSVVTERSVGRVVFCSGQIVHAVFGNLVGQEAFYGILGEDSGKFEFTPAAGPPGRNEATIHATLTELILEGARVLDTRRAARGGAGARHDSTAGLTRTSTTWSGVVEGPARGAQLASQFAQGIRDAFALGEPHLFNSDDLARWTRASGGSERLHIVLLADLQAGVSSLLPLASEPTERWVLGALSPDPKAMGLSFFLRHDRVLDIVLLDIHSAGAFQRDLRRSPSILTIAPPEGDFLAIRTRELVELDGLVRQLKPSLLLCIGDAAAEQNIKAITSVRDEDIEVRCVPGALGEGRIDLRAALVHAILCWGSPGGPPVVTPSPPNAGTRKQA